MDTKLNNEMPSNRTKYLKDIGRILVRNNGKKKYYDPNEVKKAHDSSVWMDGFDFLSCAMSVFTSHSDYDRYHSNAEEAGDYIDLKTEMLNGISNSSEIQPDTSNIDLDASWLDLEDIFDGLGDLISAIFDGV